MKTGLATLMKLIQFTDSAFPVGTFSFSNGLETAVHEGIVYDATTLEEYTRSISIQAAFSDGVVALHSFRAAQTNDYASIIEADQYLVRFRMNEESRLMLRRMGKKMAELSSKIIDSSLVTQWLGDINSNKTPGTYPVAQGIVFNAVGLSEKELYCSHQYGVINMVLSAALRCVRVSHYDTQRILFNLSAELDSLYEEASVMNLDDMCTFVPQIDILASLHEKGTMRMFMN